MGRVAGLQQEKWALEERLVMLEQSGAAMAEELVTKSELVGACRVVGCCNLLVGLAGRWGPGGQGAMGCWSARWWFMSDKRMAT